MSKYALNLLINTAAFIRPQHLNDPYYCMCPECYTFFSSGLDLHATRIRRKPSPVCDVKRCHKSATLTVFFLESV